MEDLGSIQKDFVTLDNGAEGYFIRLSDENLEKSVNRGIDGKHPMIVIIHGGPFSSSP